MLDAARAACAGVGIRGLWRGYLAGLCVWGPFSASYFGFFETVKQARRPPFLSPERTTHSLGVQALAQAGLSGLVDGRNSKLRLPLAERVPPCARRRFRVKAPQPQLRRACSRVRWLPS